MWHRIFSRLRAFLQRRDLDQELQEELRFHVDMAAQANERSGMPRDVARCRAMRDFGGVLQHAEAVRDQRWLGIDEVRQDLRHAFRTFRRAPVFSVAALLTFAIGIGATTATYSVVYSLLFRPLPLPGAERVVSVMGRSARTGVQYMGLPQDAFTALHTSGAFESVASWDYMGSRLRLAAGTHLEPVEAAEVSADFFAVAGVQPALGRAFRDAECRPGADDVVVLSHEYWQRRFGGSAGVIGRRLEFKEGGRTVIGVMPPGFWYPRVRPIKDPEVLYPSVFNWDKPLASAGAVHFLIARVRSGVSLSAAQAAADVAARRLSALPDDKDLRLSVLPFRQQMGHSWRRILLLLQAAVLLLLLTATANVGNLTLAHMRARRLEFAIRSTLGASPRRVMRQMATEAVTLAVAGGGLGIALAWWLVSVSSHLLPQRLLFAPTVRLDVHVLAVGLALSVAAGLAVALVSAMATISRPPWTGLMEGTPGRQRRSVGFLQSGLVSIQSVLAVVLLAGTGLVLHSLARLHTSTLGFGYPLARFLTVEIDAPTTDGWTRPDWAALVDRGLQVAGRVPGVEAAVSLSPSPLSMEMFGSLEVPSDDGPVRGDLTFAGPGALEALGLRPVGGRLLSDTDAKLHPDAAVVTEGFARRFFSMQNPIGRVLNVRINGKTTARTIVGVVPNVRDRNLIGESPLVMFTPFDAHAASRRRSFLVRVSPDTGDIGRSVAASLKRAGIECQVSPLAATRDVLFASERFYSGVISGFGGIALLLVLVGIAGVVGEAVVRRTREIGVRVAMGARPSQVVRLVLRQVAVPTALGVGFGTLGAIWLTRGLRGVLFEVEPGDPLTFLVVLLVTGTSALVAAWLPARRAARIDPVEALKME